MISKITLETTYKRIRQLYEGRLSHFSKMDGDGARVMESYYAGRIDALEDFYNNLVAGLGRL